MTDVLHFTDSDEANALLVREPMALGNSSAPVTPPVGPPPSRCGSIVAKPS